ncbi:MAG: FadR family transcriptional regulator [Chloroflexi bacterium]|nr:MAG: FadR family transcriptional regulator [Chloroflexota bacterium]
MFVNLPGSNPGLGAGSKAVNVRSLGANGSPRRGRRTQRAPSVTEHAIDKIRERIVSGAWGAGDRLPKESELAGELGISRNSLREAVRALSQLRVLEVRQGDGTYVSSLEPGLLLESTGFISHLLLGETELELYEVRRILEAAAAALAAGRIDAQEKVDLGQSLERMRAAHSVEELVEADVAFHALIAKAAGNTVLTSLLASLSTRTMRIRLWHGRAADDALEETREEHRRIYEALIAGDPELARATATAHIASGERWLRGQLRAGNSA